MGHKIIESLLLTTGIINLFSGVMWTFTEPTDHWLWFSRFALGIISLGLYSIIKNLNDVEKNK